MHCISQSTIYIALQVHHNWELNISWDGVQPHTPFLLPSRTPCRLPSGSNSKLHNWITWENFRWLHSKHRGWLLYHLGTSMLQTRNNEQHQETHTLYISHRETWDTHVKQALGCIATDNDLVLVLAGIQIIYFTVAGMGRCFRFVLKIVLIIRGCFCHCWTKLAQSRRFLVLIQPSQKRGWGWRRSWVGKQPGRPQLTPGIFHSVMSCLTYKASWTPAYGKGWNFMVFLCIQLLLYLLDCLYFNQHVPSSQW